jgi:hypothetical protein
MATTSNDTGHPQTSVNRVAALGPEPMRLFLVERRLPAASKRSLTMIDISLTEAVARYAARGDRVRYIRSMFIPHRDRLFSLFASVSLELVQAVNDASLVPFLTIELGILVPEVA